MVSKCINTLQHLRVLELLRRRNCGQLQGNLKLVLRKVQRHKQHQTANWTISRRVFQHFEATKWYHIYHNSQTRSMCPSKVQIFLSGLNAETAASIRLPLYLSSMTA